MKYTERGWVDDQGEPISPWWSMVTILIFFALPFAIVLTTIALIGVWQGWWRHS